MPFYTEGLLWYLVLIDCLVYNVLIWTKGKHNKTAHWVSQYFPLNKLLGLWYLILTIWLGFALYRMKLIVFWS